MNIDLSTQTRPAACFRSVLRIMEWDNNQNMNAPGAIFRDEGVIIFALEQSFLPVPGGGRWNMKRQSEVAAAALQEEMNEK